MEQFPKFQPADGHWKEYAAKSGLQSVLDPHDRRGIKNRYIDALHKLAVTSITPLTPDSLILDYGCGTGRLSRYLAPHVSRVIGADITREMLITAKEQTVSPHILFCQLDGRHLPILSSSFDLVVTVYVLQYVVLMKDAYYLLMKEFARILKAGGHLLMIEQVSLCDQQSGSVNSPIHVKDYLDTGDAQLYTLLTKGTVRLGNPGRFERLTVLNRFFPSVFYQKALQAIFKKNMTLPDSLISKQNYVDYLLYFRNQKVGNFL